MTNCVDCGIDAWGFEEDGAIVSEDFGVADELWDAAAPDDAVVRWSEGAHQLGQGRFVLCIGCFERRLGRTLTSSDLGGPAPDPLPQDVPGGFSKRYRDRLYAKTSRPVADPVPAALLELTSSLGMAVSGRAGDLTWLATAEFTGCWPIPERDRTLGKGSSCIIGALNAASCVEVELTSTARLGGWSGGWLNPRWERDRRLPRAWREAIVPADHASDLVAGRLPLTTFSTRGAPDLIFAKGPAIAFIECKIEKGVHFDNECRRKRHGDSRKESQESWNLQATLAGVPKNAIVTLVWTRRDPAPCA